MKLRKGSTFVEALVEGSPDAVVVVDRAGLMQLVNAQTERLFGYRREELLGSPVETLLPDRHREQHMRFRLQYLRDPHIRPMGAGLELYGRRKDGSEFPVDISLSPLETEDGAFAIAAIRDITERKRVDETIRRLSSIVEFSDDAIVSSTLDGVVLSWNAGAERVYGYSAAEVVGTPFSNIVPFEHQDEPRIILEKIKRGEPVEHFDTVRAKKDGSLIDVSLSVSPIRDASGTIVCAGTIARDVTKQKQLQRQLVEAVRQHSEDLHRFATSIQRAQEEERRRVAREIHDELGQRLMGFKLTIELLEDSIPKTDKKSVNKLKNIKHQIDTMFTEVRRISSNLRPTALDDFGLTVAIQLLCKEFEKVHNIPVQFTPGTLEQAGEHIEIALYRITQEALANVAKHSEASSVTVELSHCAQGLVLKIADNGKGFDAEAVQLRKGVEAGMGLLSMRERVKQVGGALEIISHPKLGTTIRAEIPPGK